MSDADVGAPLISGDGWSMRMFLNNTRFGEDIIVSADVKANTSKYRDDHAGNDVSKVDMRIWGWDLSIKAHYKTDKILQAVNAFYASKMTPGSLPVTVAIMLAIQERDSAARKPGYLFSPVVFDYNLGMPGLKERLTQSLDCWAERYKPYQAV